MATTKARPSADSMATRAGLSGRARIMSTQPATRNSTITAVVRSPVSVIPGSVRAR